MSIDQNDPRLTAYALGELENESDRIEVENALKTSPELQEVVHEIRHASSVVESILEDSHTYTLTDEQQDVIDKKLQQTSSGRFSLNKRKIEGGILAVAASVLLAILIWPILMPNLLQSKSAADGTGRSQVKNIVTSQISSSNEFEGVSRQLMLEQEAGPDPGASVIAELEPIPEEKVPESAPVPRSTIHGIVVDETGGVLPGVEVNVINTDTGVSRLVVTNDSGRYNAPNLPLGTYAVAAEMTGFKTSSLAGIHLTVGATIMANLNLELGEVSEVVNVVGGAELVDSHSITMQTLIADVAPSGPPADFNTEAYDRLEDNPFYEVKQRPLSTFSIDVDTASYSNIRRFIQQGEIPPEGAVRIEEMVNYFSYNYPLPEGERPFSANVEISPAPWNSTHLLARIGLKGKEIPSDDRPATNLVFLLDISGSMDSPNKLPLLKRSMRLLVGQLRPQDQVAIVVYAGASGLTLPSVSGADKSKILTTLDRLDAGGSTNGGQGIQLAYKVAQDNFIEDGVNRVILATDGDFNVGVTNQSELTRLIEEMAESGVFLSVLGFGMGNYKDSTLEKLADLGNGNYGYIDTIHEARKILVDQMNATLVTIAKDVKVQVEFNPTHISSYRLLGYENRLLRKQDFNDDSKDAGEIGAGHSVTALYELVPSGREVPVPDVDPLKYQRGLGPTTVAQTPELFTLKLRYKKPDEETSALMEFPIDEDHIIAEPSLDFEFAAAVAAFGMILRDSPYKGNTTLDHVIERGEMGRGQDPHGYRIEFLELVRTAKALLAAQ